MKFIDIPTEQTTSVTDIVLALLALGLAIFIYSIGRNRDLKKTRIWFWVFILLSFASVLGAIAHGIKMPEQTNYYIWQPINLALGLTVALFIAGVVYDMRGFSLPRVFLPIVLIIGVLFYLITVIFSGTFIVFILYETVGMLFAFVSYLVLAIRRKLQGSLLMALAVLITMIASGIQAIGTIHIRFIWEFDNNGLFHIIQMTGLVFFLLGLRSGFLTRTTESKVSS
jgi:hypothetical protein